MPGLVATPNGGTDAPIRSKAAAQGSGCTVGRESDLPTRAVTTEQLQKMQKKPAKQLDPILAASISASLAHHGCNDGPLVVSAKLGFDGLHDVATEVLSKPQTDAGLKPSAVLHNLSVAELYENALKHEPGTHIVSSGALATLSGAKTGRSPKDKRIMRDPESEGDVWWGQGSPNIEIDERTFLINRARAIDYLNFIDRVYVFDGFVNWDPAYRFKVRVITSRAYHALFMYNMLIRPTAEELASFGDPDFVIYNAGAFPANRYSEYMTSTTSVDLSFKHNEMVILGSQYAGCMKKGIFTVMNYLLPKQGVLSLHSGCNIGPAGDVSLFFGLSGTGKTTLSADPHRPLIGDDEHGWSDNGVFNLEGGCYAKAINLDPTAEPDIYDAIRFGTVLENVVFDSHSHDVDFGDSSITENTRASYPIQYISNALIPCVGPHPANIIMLTCDAFGVLPPVSKLTPEQAMYHFVSGYTAKVAGTEVGITEPEATFSACFGSAFLVWHPMKYADMLADKMKRHGATAWLVNTGWTGGKYGVGKRMSIKHTRAIIDAIHSGKLQEQECVQTDVFRLKVPKSCAGVPNGVLLPHLSWPNQAEFRATLSHLAALFKENFEKFKDGAGLVSENLAATILAAGPL